MKGNMNRTALARVLVSVFLTCASKASAYESLEDYVYCGTPPVVGQQASYMGLSLSNSARNNLDSAPAFDFDTLRSGSRFGQGGIGHLRTINGETTDSIEIAVNSDLGPRIYSELDGEWTMPNMDPENVVRDAKLEKAGAYLKYSALGFSQAYMVGREIYGLQAAKVDLLIDPNPIKRVAAYREILSYQDFAGRVMEIDRVHKKPIRDAVDDIKRADDKVKYYEAEIGSDRRPTNVSYEVAEEGYKFERRLPDGKYEDPDTGEVYETKVYQMRAQEEVKPEPKEEGQS